MEKKVPLKNRTSSLWKVYFSAYAANNDPCFFGGWESIELDGFCKFPKTEIGYTPCDNREQFRCSPTLFGSHCVDTGGIFFGLTQKCYERAQSDVANIIQNIQDNPQDIDKIEAKINQLCQLNPGYDACEFLITQVRKIQQSTSEVAISPSQIEDNIAQNKALGILNACQEHYERENSGFFARMFSSDRNIIAGIKDNYAPCEQALSGIADRNIEDLEEVISEIGDSINGREILASINRTSLRGNLQALFLTQREYGVEIQQREVLRNFCSKSGLLRRRSCRVNPELLDLIRQEIDTFQSIQLPLPAENIIKTIQAMKFFGEEINRECRNFREKYRVDLTAKCLPGRNRRGVCTRHTEYAKNLWTERQNTMQRIVDNLGVSFKRFFVTEHFRDKIFPFDGEVAKRCAEGRISEVFNINLTPEDIMISVQQFQEIMYDELKAVYSRQMAIDNQDHNRIYDEIKDILKYRPYLMRNYLKQFSNDSQESEDTANYICKASLEIYSSDEFWNIAEVGIGAATVATAVAAAFIPGVGPFLSTGVIATMSTTASVGVVGGELALAASRVKDSSLTLQGVTTGVVGGSVSRGREQSEIERAESQRNRALVDGALAIVGAASVPRVVRGVRRTTNATTPRGSPQIVESGIEEVSPRSSSERPVLRKEVSPRPTIDSGRKSLTGDESALRRFMHPGEYEGGGFLKDTFSRGLKFSRKT